MPLTPTWATAVQGLSPTQLHDIACRMRSMAFSRGADLITESSRNPNLFVVRKGRLKTVFVDASGRERVRSVLGPGALIGIATNLTELPAAFTLRAMSAVSADAIARTDFIDCMRRIPAFAVNVAVLIAAMYHARLVADKVLDDSAPIRLGKVLADLATRPGWSSNGQLVTISGVTHQDLAAMVGVSRSWVTQMLASFEAGGVLACGRSEIHIPDLGRLARYVRRLEQGAD